MHKTASSLFSVVCLPLLSLCWLFVSPSALRPLFVIVLPLLPCLVVVSSFRSILAQCNSFCLLCVLDVSALFMFIYAIVIIAISRWRKNFIYLLYIFYVLCVCISSFAFFYSILLVLVLPLLTSTHRMHTGIDTKYILYIRNET